MIQDLDYVVYFCCIMEIPLLKDIVIIFALSAVVILLFHRLKIPPIIGFLVTGIIIGPSGILHYSVDIDLIQNSHNEIDQSAIFNIVRNARAINPELSIIARTRYVDDVEDLYKAGATEVIPEEFETSLEIFARVLNRYLIPKIEIDKLVTEFRSHGYGVLRET